MSLISSVTKSAVVGSAMLALASAIETDMAPPLLQTALEVVSRASSSSEVLSLNLTNLIILLALKVAIVAFGLFSGGATGRSDTPPATSQEEITGGMCFLLYTGGDVDKLSCMQRAACEDSTMADNYLSAAKLWYKMHKIINVIPFNSEMKSLMIHINDAKDAETCDAFKW